MVGPLSVLRPDTGRSMAKPNPPLCSLQQTADTGNARGLGPSYLEVYECNFDRPLTELASVENKLAHFVDTDIQVLGNNFAR
jgi:hypothetical protein